MTDFAALTTERTRDGEQHDLDLMETGALVAAMVADLDTVQDALRTAEPAIAAAIDGVAARMAAGGRLLYLGAGTSGRLAVLDAAECIPTFGAAPGQVQAMIAGGAVARGAAVEAAEDDEQDAIDQLADAGVTERDSVMGVSASGRTPFVLAGVRSARRLGALTVGVSCNLDTPLSEAVDHPIELLTGPEILAGSTRLKAGTAQKIVFNAVSTIVMVRLGKTYRNLMVDVRPSNHKLAERARRIVALATGASGADAQAALDQAGGDAKTAIIALACTLSPEAAGSLLAEHGGHLRSALDAWASDRDRS